MYRLHKGYNLKQTLRAWYSKVDVHLSIIALLEMIMRLFYTLNWKIHCYFYIDDLLIIGSYGELVVDFKHECKS